MSRQYPFMGFIATKKYPLSGYPYTDNLGMKDINQIIASRLNQARRQTKLGKQLTLKEIASKSGIPYSTVQRISKAETDPQISNLVAIAKALDMELSDLFDEKPTAAFSFKNTQKLTSTQVLLVQNLINSLIGEPSAELLTTEEVIQKKRAQDDLANMSQLESIKNK